MRTPIRGGWGYLPGRMLDEQVHANWYVAACRAATEAGIRAVWFWNANFSDDPSHPSFPDYPEFKDKRAADVIHDC